MGVGEEEGANIGGGHVPRVMVVATCPRALRVKRAIFDPPENGMNVDSEQIGRAVGVQRVDLLADTEPRSSERQWRSWYEQTRAL